MANPRKMSGYVVAALFVGFSLGWMTSVARYGLAFGPFPPSGATVRQPLTRELLTKALVPPHQQDEILALQSRELSEIQMLLRKMGQATVDFEEALENQESSGDIQEKHTSMLNAREDLEREHFKILTEVHSRLTPEQARALKRLIPPPGAPQP